MTEASVNPEPKAVTPSGNTKSDDGRATFTFSGPSTVGDIAGRDIIVSVMSGELALVAAAAVYSKAFLETLAKRHADGFADLVRTRIGKRKDTEAEVGLDDGTSAATIAITADLPDEARLALLDLDVTADDVRGKLLRWDDEKSTWRPEGDA